MKRLLLFIILGLLWAFPAHASLFYEFNPDYSQSLLVASSETVSEIFLPLNDYLGALDFWVSNANTAGDATFTMYNAAGTVVAERTVAVPAIADTADGTRLRVTLPAQIAVTSNAAYRIRIVTATPTFRLYYADATQLLAHNGVPLPSYTGGLARIGTDDMGFSFKFALYENHETAPPLLTGVTVTQQNPHQATINFNANEPVDRHLQYGSTTINWNGEYSSCAPNIQACTVTLAVSPATTYQYTLTVQDVWGNQTTTTGTFTTLDEGQTPAPTPTATPTPTISVTITPTPTATPDTTGPSLSNVRLVSSTPNSAAFAWTTNEAANSLVVVQMLPLFISAGANNDSALELEHFVSVGALTSDTLYRATITSSDIAGNSGVATLDFMTPRLTPTPSPGTTVPPPAIVSPAPAPSSTPAVSGSSDNPQLTWSPPIGGEPSNGYRIDIFDSANNLIKTITVAPGQHQIALGALPTGNNRVVVYANNNGVFEKVAAPTAITTRPPKPFLERALGALPYILGGVVFVILGAVVVTKLRMPKTPPMPPAVVPVAPSPITVSPSTTAAE
ncbi:MAG: hypothetical protein AAB375_02840 [Patescibacteria group bacterium]